MSDGRRTSYGEDFSEPRRTSTERRLRTNRFADEPRKIRRERNEFEEREPKEPKGPGKVDPTIIFIIITVVIVIGIFATFLFLGIKNGKTTTDSKPANTVEMEVVEEAKLDDTYEGFKVLGKIKIEDIEVEQYILDSTGDKALNVGVGKLYGGSLNGFGNFSIAGHNKDKIFKDLEELDKGDTFIIVDKNLKETTYKITEITTVEPDDLECLRSDDSKCEITLITCQDGTTSRLVVKAEKQSTNDVDDNV